MNHPDAETIKEYVRQRYGALAGQAEEDMSECPGPAPMGASGDESSRCCGSADGAAADIYSSQLGYSPAEQAAVPPGANLGLGCGNPVALAGIKPGETVLDLGCGAGFDALLAASRLAGTGRVIGVDMTAEMLTKARLNARKAGLENVEFRLGEIEALPVADAAVDLIISNCVINLSPDKPRVFAEAMRVLKPGGRLAVSDIVATRTLPEAVRARLPLIGACIAGAVPAEELRAMLHAAGFARVEIVPRAESRQFIALWNENPEIADWLVSANITADKD